VKHHAVDGIVRRGLPGLLLWGRRRRGRITFLLPVKEVKPILETRTLDSQRGGVTMKKENSFPNAFRLRETLLPEFLMVFVI